MANMDIRALRTFVAVVEEGSFSAAGQRLHTSQSTVSETIGSLERELGVSLLVRSRTGTRETEAGRKLAFGARKILCLQLCLISEVTAKDAAIGTVRLGVPSELPAELLPNVIAKVASTRPGIVVDTQFASTIEQWAALRKGAIDVGLVRELMPDEEFDSLLIGEDRLGVILAKDKADAIAGADGSIELNDLPPLAWTGFVRADSPAAYDRTAATLRSHGIRVPDPQTVDQRIDSVEVKRAAIADGTRFALALPDFPLTPGFTWRPLVGNPITRRTWAVWRADETNREVAAIVSALEEEQDHPVG